MTSCSFGVTFRSIDVIVQSKHNRKDCVQGSDCKHELPPNDLHKQKLSPTTSVSFRCDRRRRTNIYLKTNLSSTLGTRDTRRGRDKTTAGKATALTDGSGGTRVAWFRSACLLPGCATSDVHLDKPAAGKACSP